MADRLIELKFNEADLVKVQEGLRCSPAVNTELSGHERESTARESTAAAMRVERLFHNRHRRLNSWKLPSVTDLGSEREPRICGSGTASAPERLQ